MYLPGHSSYYVDANYDSKFPIYLQSVDPYTNFISDHLLIFTFPILILLNTLTVWPSGSLSFQTPDQY